MYSAVTKFTNLNNTPLDPIMIANYEWPDFKERFENPINATIGVMVDPDSGDIWRPTSVIRARIEAQHEIDEHRQFGYQPMQGNQGFLSEAVKFVFGEDNSEVLTYQTSGGTGALSLVAEILPNLLSSNLLAFDSGWPNHDVIFGKDFELKTYDHVDEAGDYNHQNLLDLMNHLKAGSTLLLQVCGYNGDGVDRTKHQWDELIELAKEKNLVLILDAAYLGLVKSVEKDSYPIRKARESGVLAFVCVSFSKNMGLYNERLGALMIVNSQSVLGFEQSENLDSLVKTIIRRTFSSLPLLVSSAAKLTLQDKEFINELDVARASLSKKRARLEQIIGDIFPVVGKGSGLFTTLYKDGFNDKQYETLRSQGALLLQNSRINIGGLKNDQVDRLSDIIKSVV